MNDLDFHISQLVVANRILVNEGAGIFARGNS
jgi:hypothetical protein